MNIFDKKVKNFLVCGGNAINIYNKAGEKWLIIIKNIYIKKNIVIFMFSHYFIGHLTCTYLIKKTAQRRLQSLVQKRNISTSYYYYLFC